MQEKTRLVQTPKSPGRENKRYSVTVTEDQESSINEIKEKARFVIQ